MSPLSSPLSPSPLLFRRRIRHPHLSLRLPPPSPTFPRFFLLCPIVSSPSRAMDPASIDATTDLLCTLNFVTLPSLIPLHLFTFNFTRLGHPSSIASIPHFEVGADEGEGRGGGGVSATLLWKPAAEGEGGGGKAKGGVGVADPAGFQRRVADPATEEKGRRGKGERGEERGDMAAKWLPRGCHLSKNW